MKKDELLPSEQQKKMEESDEKKRKLLKKAFEFFITNTASIEVIRNDQIEIIYFILLPYTHLLPKEKKDEFHEKVDRSSTKSKI